MEDAQLLHRYAENGSEDAFTELVHRHLPLVYSTAARQTGGDEELAKDVAQTVFIDLARKARSLAGREFLAGWLYNATRLATSKASRVNRRRQIRELTAVAMQENAFRSPVEQEHGVLRRVLDEAMGELDPEDRNAVLLRFFQDKGLREVGAALGISEDAARMRVNRSLGKLHSLLIRRGVTLSIVALGSALTTEAVTAPPAGLATAIAGTALASVPVSGGITVTLVKVLTMTKVQAGVFGAILIACVAIPVAVQRQSRNQLHDENRALRQQVDQLAAENERLSNLVSEANSFQALAKDQSNELLRLRGAVGVLSQQKSEAERLREENRQLRTGVTNAQIAQATNPPTPLSASVPKESWAFSGYATPEGALQTMVWAWANHDTETLLASCTPEGREWFEKAFEGKQPSEVLAEFPVDLSKASGYQFSTKEASDDKVDYFVVFDMPFHVAYGRDVTMKKVGGEWKAE